MRLIHHLLLPVLSLCWSLHAGQVRCAELNPHAEVEAPLPKASEWLSYNGSLAGTRFSTLAQINVGNAANLTELCRVRVGELGPFHSAPVLTNNLMYLTTGHATIALNPANCDVMWKSVHTADGPELWTSNMGLAVERGKLFRGTPDVRLIAYDAITGRELWKTVVGDGGAGELLDSAPLAWNGLVFIGVSGGDFGIRGRMLAFEADTGKPVWQFNLIPAPGEPGSETWPGNSYEHGGGGTWTSYALDPETRELFVPVSNPAPSFDGTTRQGDNLYTGSLVVLDAITGKLRWYYQVRPHDEHDYGVTSPPLLYSTANGLKLTAFGIKDGFVYGIDRLSHKLIFKTAVTTIKNHNVKPTPAGIEICPGVLGGVEWNGPALDSTHSALVVGANDWCSRVRSMPQEYERGKLFTKGAVEMLGRPSGTITSLDAATGKIRWQRRTPNGVVAAVLPTAGGVVFAGDLDGTLYALRSEDGEILKTFATGGALAGGIVTYTVADQQYVAVASGNISRSTFGAVGIPTLIIYALQEKGGPTPKHDEAATSAHGGTGGAGTGGGGTSGGGTGSGGGGGASRYAQLCGGCHGAHGEGSLGPPLKGIVGRLSREQTIARIKHPPSNRMPTLYPDTVSDADIDEITSYIGSFQ